MSNESCCIQNSPVRLVTFPLRSVMVTLASNYIHELKRVCMQKEFRRRPRRIHKFVATAVALESACAARPLRIRAGQDEPEVGAPGPSHGAVRLPSVDIRGERSILSSATFR